VSASLQLQNFAQLQQTEHEFLCALAVLDGEKDASQLIKVGPDDVIH
jgi:hypothetical protein